MEIRASSNWRSRLLSDRRRFVAAGLGALCAGATGAAQEVSGLDLSLLDDWLTPNELFFVRDQGAATPAAGAKWSVPVAGLVAKPFDLQPDELEGVTRKKIAATLDCAGQPAGGGLFSTAEWTGVPLSLVLEKAGIEPGARAVRLTGAGGYTRTLPIAKAMHADTLLADRMNGARLPNAHGYPVRAIVPGWYGSDSVKWLQRIEALSEERPSEAGGPQEVNVVFSRPVEGAVLVGRRFLLRGAAWAGERRIQSVEISTDGGIFWAAATLDDAPRPYAWVRWRREWKIPAPGEHTLLARARDDSGRVREAREAWQKARVSAL